MGECSLGLMLLFIYGWVGALFIVIVWIYARTFVHCGCLSDGSLFKVALAVVLPSPFLPCHLFFLSLSSRHLPLFSSPLCLSSLPSLPSLSTPLISLSSSITIISPFMIFIQQYSCSALHSAYSSPPCVCSVGDTFSLIPWSEIYKGWTLN